MDKFLFILLCIKSKRWCWQLIKLYKHNNLNKLKTRRSVSLTSLLAVSSLWRCATSFAKFCSMGQTAAVVGG